MLKWIKNTKGIITNKSTKYKGITFQKGKYVARVTITLQDRKLNKRQAHVLVGRYETLSEAKKERINYILGLM